jgi:hypothetical protein
LSLPTWIGPPAVARVHCALCCIAGCATEAEAKQQIFDPFSFRVLPLVLFLISSSPLPFSFLLLRFLLLLLLLPLHLFNSPMRSPASEPLYYSLDSWCYTLPRT